MKCYDLDTLRSLDLPSIPKDFFQPQRVTNRKRRCIPLGTIVCLEFNYHFRDESNPEGMWGYVNKEDPVSVFVRWDNGIGNVYHGCELCTFEEFLERDGEVLPFSWRN